MPNMRQSKTDFGDRKGETGESIPRKSASVDESGERKTKVPREDREQAEPGETGEREPKAAKSRDASGEERKRIEGGVGQGKADSIGARESAHLGRHDGRTGELNDGNKGEREVYSHERIPHQQDVRHGERKDGRY
jgi:hypothetical protein